MRSQLLCKRGPSPFSRACQLREVSLVLFRLRFRFADNKGQRAHNFLNQLPAQDNPNIFGICGEISWTGPPVSVQSTPGSVHLVDRAITSNAPSSLPAWQCTGLSWFSSWGLSRFCWEGCERTTRCPFLACHRPCPFYTLGCPKTG